MRFHHTFILVMCLVCFPAAAVQGELYLYDVDLGGVENNNELHVAGTITFDTERGEISASSLTMHFNTESVALSEGPLMSEQTLWHWSATPTELRFVVDQSFPIPSELVVWQSAPTASAFGQFFLETRAIVAPVPILEMYYARPPNVDGQYHQFFDSGPPGFLVGTAVIPEPSATLLSSAFVVMAGGIAVWRKREKRLPHAVH